MDIINLQFEMGIIFFYSYLSHKSNKTYEFTAVQFATIKSFV